MTIHVDLWLKLALWCTFSHLDIDQIDCLNSKGIADPTVAQALCAASQSAREEELPHESFTTATDHQLGLYSQAGDVFSSGIYPPHCCPARKTSIHSSAATTPPKLNKESGSLRSEASLP